MSPRACFPSKNGFVEASDNSYTLYNCFALPKQIVGQVELSLRKRSEQG
jgi:hypothetical protein